MSNKTVIITGAGRGLGRHFAIEFAKKGYDVVVTSRSINEINNTLNEIKKIGQDGLAIKADVSIYDDAQNLVSKSIEKFGSIDVLINNAGIITPIGPFYEIDCKEWTHTISVNLFGTFYCTHCILPHMISKNHGKIINLSGGGVKPLPFFSAYSTSKASIVKFTESISSELSQFNIFVNAIAPGGLKTKMMDDVLSSGKKAGNELENAQKIIESGGTDFNKASTLALFLASSESDGLTGRTISAKWDDIEYIKSHIAEIQNSDKFQMKRSVD